MGSHARSVQGFAGASIVAVVLGFATAASGMLTFTVEPSPNDGADHNALRAVAAASGTSALAVGEYDEGEYGYLSSRTLVVQWNGRSWHQLSAANEGTQGNKLDAVAMVSATSAFAVGQYYSGASYHTLAEYFDGRTWRVQYSPTITPHDNLLAGVAASSPTNAWAVGDYFNGTVRSHRTLIEHFNGSRWSIVTSPNVGGGNNFLSAVAIVPGTSATQAWAVGSYAAKGESWPLVEHLVRGTWRVVSAPSGGTKGGVLNGVAAVTRSAVFAVGAATDAAGTSTIQRTLVERWGGAAWHVIDSANQGTHGNALTSVTALSARSVVAVGRSSTGSHNQTLVERLVRGRFSLMASGNPTAGNDLLLGAAAVGGLPVWAVGLYYSGSSDRTLIEQMCPAC